MNNSFNELGISQPILQAIEDMGFENPTEVQAKAIPHILNKQDLIVKSKTGSGKTAVFGVSMLQLTDPASPGPQGLILTPTRELAVQVDSDIKLLAKHLQHKTTAVFGQHSMNIEIQALSKGVTIVTGTPGRVFDHIRQGKLITKNIRFLVLDEADRMLDMGFLDQVVKIIRTIPKDRVTLLFSATIPDEVHRIVRDYMKSPVIIEIESQTKTVDTIKQSYYKVAYNEKNTQLNRLLLFEQPDSCMIFCNTKIAVDRVQSFLTRKGYASQALHGDIPQAKRIKTIQQFREGEFHILVATDVAARGLHIDELSLVINYDVPLEKDSYVHRIGRTGRAGNEGRAITFATSEDIMSLYEIEEHIGAMIEEADLPTEEDFASRKEGAEKWVLANALKGTAEEASNDRRRQPGSAYGQGGRSSGSSSGAGTGYGSGRSQGSGRTRNKPAGSGKVSGAVTGQAIDTASATTAAASDESGTRNQRTPGQNNGSQGPRPPRQNNGTQGQRSPRQTGGNAQGQRPPRQEGGSAQGQRPPRQDGGYAQGQRPPRQDGG
ncbi:MAG: DEAD/DEAH box helicase, partial [Clostridiales bacterium]|nr:DEAD/DEAH box helicase [Clostridiales bacterium]